MDVFQIEDSRRLPYQIHSELDDFGLDPYQFRVYCRICRRYGNGSNGKDCYESVSNIAAGCKMSTGKVKQCLKWLIDHKFITRHPCVGKPSIYRLSDMGLWVRPDADNSKTRPPEPQSPSHVTTQPCDDPGHEVAGGGHVTTQVPGHVVATKESNKGIHLRKAGETEKHPCQRTNDYYSSGGANPADEFEWAARDRGRIYRFDPRIVERAIDHLSQTEKHKDKNRKYLVGDAQGWLRKAIEGQDDYLQRCVGWWEEILQESAIAAEKEAQAAASLAEQRAKDAEWTKDIERRKRRQADPGIREATFAEIEATLSEYRDRQGRTA